MFKELDPLLHSELRLAVMSILISVEEADFVFIKEQTKATSGNLSVQIDKLSKAKLPKLSKVKCLRHFAVLPQSAGKPLKII